MPPAEIVEHVDITPTTAIAAVTRGLVVDEALIPSLLGSASPYIGLIGSRRGWALTAQALMERGISRNDLARVHAPIGLELGAETPKEIAVSILAEIVMTLRGGSGESMQWLGPEKSG